ncbi:MmgE/PrpD family protein [Halomicrococcus sp. NG-SE-24]|uniref:MmgE/PrpD family protein n=1 Tax=Halomicrococcus sp. NG-SE-24 TaxID=3436928 RepID=UPI003D9878FA
MESPETTLSDFITSLTYGDLPSSVRETIRRAFLDTVGVILAGAVEDAGKSVFETNGIAAETTDPMTLLGITGDDSAEERALRTGTAGHALDYDDLSWAMDGHPSVTLIPPLLALSADVKADGKALMTAYAAGFEVESALAQPISPEHYEAGWHATATFGAFGAAAAAASLLNLARDEVKQALNIAASTPSGLKRNFGSMTKPLHAGLCARSGITAARLAADGFTADATAVSGDRGFWNLYGPDERDQFEFSRDDWALESTGINVKYFPCCYFTHTSIAATQQLIDEHDIDASEIDRVAVSAAQGALDALHHTNPTTGLEAKFSMEYTVASAAVHDRVGLGVFADDAVDNPDVQSVRERVDVEADDNLHYDSHEAIVRIETATGAYERRQKNPPGTHTNPLTDDELRAKFDECARRVVSPEDADRLADVFTALDEQDSLAATLSA